MGKLASFAHITKINMLYDAGKKNRNEIIM